MKYDDDYDDEINDLRNEVEDLKSEIESLRDEINDDDDYYIPRSYYRALTPEQIEEGKRRGRIAVVVTLVIMAAILIPFIIWISGIKPF